MKNIVFALMAFVLLVAAADSSHAQNRKEWLTGVEGLLGPTGTTTDTVRSVGKLSLLNTDFTRIDSVAFRVSYQDSIRAALRVKLRNAFGVVTDSASVNQVAGDKIIDTTTAGHTVYPWHMIRAALGDKVYGASSMDVELIIYQVGTEIRSSGKKYRVDAVTYTGK